MSAPRQLRPVTREQANELIRSTSPACLLCEVEFHTHDVGGREYAYDELSALFDVEERNEGPEGDRAVLRAARQLLVALGFYRPMSADEIASTVVSRGRVWAFKVGGVAYTADDPVELWQWPGEGRWQ